MMMMKASYEGPRRDRGSKCKSSRPSPAARLAVAAGKVFLKFIIDTMFVIQMNDRLPSILLTREALPLDKVLDTSTASAFLENSLYFELVMITNEDWEWRFLAILRGPKWWSSNCLQGRSDRR